MSTSASYVIQISRRWKKKWDMLDKEIPEALTKCRSFLEKSPEDRLASAGKLKKLKGKWKGLLQYDINDEARVIYNVDRSKRVVYIEYVGHHP